MDHFTKKIISYIIIGILSCLICIIGIIILTRYIIPLCCCKNHDTIPVNSSSPSQHSLNHSTTIGLDVQLWLENHNIPEYYAILINIGIDTLDKLLKLNNLILTEQTQMSFEQKNILLNKIKQYKIENKPISLNNNNNVIKNNQLLNVNDYNSLKSFNLNSLHFKSGHDLKSLSKKVLLNSLKIEELYESEVVNNGIITKDGGDINIELNTTNFANRTEGENDDHMVIDMINNKLDLNKWENWTSDEICDWIMTLDNGIYKKYERKLRIKFTEMNINKEAVILLAHIDWMKMFGIDKDVDITQHIIQLTNVKV